MSQSDLRFFIVCMFLFLLALAGVALLEGCDRKQEPPPRIHMVTLTVDGKTVVFPVCAPGTNILVKIE